MINKLPTCCQKKRSIGFSPGLCEEIERAQTTSSRFSEEMAGISGGIASTFLRRIGICTEPVSSVSSPQLHKNTGKLMINMVIIDFIIIT